MARKGAHIMVSATQVRLFVGGCVVLSVMMLGFLSQVSSPRQLRHEVTNSLHNLEQAISAYDEVGEEAAAVEGGAPRALAAQGSDAHAPRTTFKCFESAEFAQVCTYDLMCFDGEKVVLVDDRRQDFEPIEHHHQVGDDTRGAHNFDVCPRPPPASQGLPVNTRLDGYWRHPSSLFDGSTEIEWTDKAMWLIEPEYRSWEMQHIFFWAHGVFGMWEARVSNASWSYAMPPLDEIWINKPREITLNGWNQATLDLITDGFNSKVLDMEDGKGYNKNRLRCTRRGAVPGQKSTIFSGIRGAVLFRQAAYNLFGITEPARPPKHLLIFNREGAGRSFENMEEIKGLLAKHSIPHTIVSSHGSFENQVRLMSGAGVLLIAHGAAATNAIFQPHRSVLVEVFPYQRKRFGFMQASTQAGMFYMPIFSWKKPTTGDGLINDPSFDRDCASVSSINTNHIRTCDLAQKVARINIPIDILESTLIDAFDTIGYRVDLQQ